jgi:stearoyl-CoA desaturase (delta-9 desaturase)
MNSLVFNLVQLFNKLVLTFFICTFTFLIPYFLYTASWLQLIIAYIGLWFFCDIVFSTAYHRWLAHKYWTPPVAVQYFFGVLGCASLIGNPIDYVQCHRTHHKFFDTELDPHSPKYRNFFRMTIFLYFTQFKKDIVNSSDVTSNKFFVWLSYAEGLIAITVTGLLYTVLSFDWFLTLWAIPVISGLLCHLVAANWVAHNTGEPRDTPQYWLWMFGECKHKSHHELNKMSHTKYDPGFYIIKWLGWYK